MTVHRTHPWARCAASPSRWPAWAPTLALALVLAGCATRGPSGRDGPPESVPPGLADTPDAEPRIEPLRVGGPNKPYVVLGRRYEPMTTDAPLFERGGASWYGRKFHGHPTSSGEPYDMFAMTAAHKTMPIPSYASVRNPANGREVVVRINDRGPFADGRVIDLSYVAALRLGVLRGVAPVEVRRITHAQIRSGWAAPGAAPDPAPDPPSDPTVTTLTAVAGYWVQVGAFERREGALELQRRLLQDWPGQGVAVFDEASLHRVQLGPFETREQAQQMARRLRERSGLVGLLVERP